MIYSSIGPNSRFFSAMTNALASAGSSKNARNSTVRRAVISFGRPAPARTSELRQALLGAVHGPRARLVGKQRRAGLAPERRRAVFLVPAGVERVRRAREKTRGGAAVKKADSSSGRRFMRLRRGFKRENDDASNAR